MDIAERFVKRRYKVTGKQVRWSRPGSSLRQFRGRNVPSEYSPEGVAGLRSTRKREQRNECTSNGVATLGKTKLERLIPDIRLILRSPFGRALYVVSFPRPRIPVDIRGGSLNPDENLIERYFCRFNAMFLSS